MEKKNETSQEANDTAKRPYEQPQLTEIGDVRTLTRGGTSQSIEISRPRT